MMIEVVVTASFLSYGRKLYRAGEKIAVDRETADSLLKRNLVAGLTNDVPESADVIETVDINAVEDEAELPEIKEAPVVKSKGGNGRKKK